MTGDEAEIQHFHLVQRLKKPGFQIQKTLSSGDIDLWHGATGICTEAGELLDAVKKTVIYDEPLNVENVIEELGDLEFYMRQVRQNLGISRKETLGHNLQKLNTRYPEGYTNEAAIARADKESAV